ncbi:hypothetical protein QQ045_000774 [Rhodiola kirilowii]
MQPLEPRFGHRDSHGSLPSLCKWVKFSHLPVHRSPKKSFLMVLADLRTPQIRFPSKPPHRFGSTSMAAWWLEPPMRPSLPTGDEEIRRLGRQMRSCRLNEEKNIAVGEKRLF